MFEEDVTVHLVRTIYQFINGSNGDGFGNYLQPYMVKYI